jgi:hypothetical protein
VHVSQGWIFWKASACHLSLQASGRPNSPFSPCGRRGQGVEGRQSIRTPKLPLLPLWEKGAGGMRGKSAPECTKSLISPKKSTLERRHVERQRGRRRSGCNRHVGVLRRRGMRRAGARRLRRAPAARSTTMAASQAMSAALAVMPAATRAATCADSSPAAAFIASPAASAAASAASVAASITTSTATATPERSVMRCASAVVWRARSATASAQCWAA